MKPVGDRGFELTAREVAQLTKSDLTRLTKFSDKAIDHSGNGNTGSQTLIFQNAGTN